MNLHMAFLILLLPDTYAVTSITTNMLTTTTTTVLTTHLLTLLLFLLFPLPSTLPLLLLLLLPPTSYHDTQHFSSANCVHLGEEEVVVEEEEVEDWRVRSAGQLLTRRSHKRSVFALSLKTIDST